MDSQTVGIAWDGNPHQDKSENSPASRSTEGSLNKLEIEMGMEAFGPMVFPETRRGPIRAPEFHVWDAPREMCTFTLFHHGAI